MTDTVFGRMFKRTATPGLLRQFGESIEYWPRDRSGGRTIKAMVERDIPEELVGGEITSQAIIVRVKNCEKDGISSDEINTGGDQISVSLRIGQDAEKRSISRVISDANGLLRLLCN